MGLMSVHLNKELREKHRVRSMPVRKDDEVMIVRGKNKGHSGKVTDVYRRRWCLYIDGLSKSKPNGQPVRVPIDPSNCVLTKIKLTKDRQDLIVRKARNSAKLKGKTTEKRQPCQIRAWANVPHSRHWRFCCCPSQTRTIQAPKKGTGEGAGELSPLEEPVDIARRHPC